MPPGGRGAGASLVAPPFDYHGGTIEPYSFLDTDLHPTPRLLLGTFKAKQPQLFAALSHVKTKFNPVRQVAHEERALIRKIEHA